MVPTPYVIPHQDAGVYVYPVVLVFTAFARCDFQAVGKLSRQAGYRRLVERW